MEETMDKSRDTTSRSSSASRSVHQLCVIITEAAEEENNHSSNKEVDIQVDKIRSNSKKEKEKVHVLAREWRMIMTAVNHRTDVPADSRREVLMGYQYALHQHRKKLRQERDMIITAHQVKDIGANIPTRQNPACRGHPAHCGVRGFTLGHLVLLC
jgi:hypothetical protein